MGTTWYGVVRNLARTLIPLQARFTFSHQERVPLTGGVLLVCNHLGPTDPIFVGARLGRQLRILAKAEIFEWPVLGWLARRCGTVPIRRGESDRDALTQARDLLAQEQCVLVFPEGTYADPPAPAAMLPIKTGAAWLALRTGVPVVPVAVAGSERLWTLPRGWRIWHHPHVHVIFGEPYHPTVPRGASMRGVLQSVADEMGRRIAELLPDTYRGWYATAGGGGDMQDVTDAPHPEDATLAPAGFQPM